MKPVPSRSITGSAIGSASSAAVQIWRDWRAKRRPVVLRPYVDQHNRWRRASGILLPLGLALICFVYGFFFALTAPYLIVPFAAPALVLGLMSIWALPDADWAPVRSLEFAYSAVLPGLILWPNYLALALPGLPWITMVRLTAFPMGFFLLISLSTSPHFRETILRSAKGAPLMVYLLLVFSANSLVSLPLAHGVGDAIQKLMIQMVTWTGMFIAGLYVFQLPGRPERYVTLMLMLAVPVVGFTVVEFQEQHTMWLGHVPSFLKIADPSVQISLSNAVRSATGQFRAKFAFSTALGLAEYIALMTPFAVHWAVGRYSWPQRLFGLALLPAIYVVVRMTDSRLGILGYLVSILAYALVWSLIRFRRRINDLAAAIIVYAYPAAFLGVLAASMVFHKIHVLIFGGGAQEASNEHRQEQFRMAIPALLRNPIGHGAGQSGMAMGYGAGDFIAIDSYYITIGLDYGVLGLVLYVGMFGIVIATAVKILLERTSSEDSTIGLLTPLIGFFCAFLFIRGVFSQPDIQPLVFALLGMAVCLIARARREHPVVPAPVAPAASGLAGRRRARPLTAPVEAKPMGFGMLMLIVVACSVALYIGCAAWLLAH